MKKYHVVVSPDLLNRQFVVSVTPYVPGLKRVQDLVGGYIESVPVESLLPHASLPYVLAWVDEEGLLKELCPSMIMYTSEGFLHGVVHGPVVFECYDDSGDSDGLPASYVYQILGSIQNMYRCKIEFSGMTESELFHS